MARRAWTLEDLTVGVRAGERRALARAITLVENGDPLAYPLVRELYPETGRAAVIDFMLDVVQSTDTSDLSAGDGPTLGGAADALPATCSPSGPCPA